MERFTDTQKKRLVELGASRSIVNSTFSDSKIRDSKYREFEKELVALHVNRIKHLMTIKKKTDVELISDCLKMWLIDKEGFCQVSTPSIISGDMLEKMTIGVNHPLAQQVYWIESNKCLRPMLAPGLYVLMRELGKVVGGPVKIFEMGTCYRKESKGPRHMNEFTMLNLVEMSSVKEGEQKSRLTNLITALMEVVGIKNYDLTWEDSVVYGETLDVVCNNIEVASSSYGPHVLDGNWNVFDPWVGIGIGIERLAQVKQGYDTIKRVGRSINYIDGSPLRL